MRVRSCSPGGQGPPLLLAPSVPFLVLPARPLPGTLFPRRHVAALAAPPEPHAVPTPSSLSSAPLTSPGRARHAAWLTLPCLARPRQGHA